MPGTAILPECASRVKKGDFCRGHVVSKYNTPYTIYQNYSVVVSNLHHVRRLNRVF